MCLIRNILFFSFLVGLVLAAGAQQKPNIVVILVDDAGNKDWGFQGSTVSQTPAIDNLASLGTIFTQGYVTNSVCAPSRAGMLTGQYQNKFGFEGNIVEYTSPPDHDDQDVGLDPSVPTIGNYLQDLGYSTGLFGKWHLGVEEHHRPNARGFDYFYGLLGGSRDYNVVETEFARQLRRNGAIAEPSGDFYVTDLLTDEALEYMTEQIDMNRPFMAFMSYTAPHSPFQAKAEDKALFTHLTELSDKQHEYYGMIKNVDDNVQRIVDLLQAKNEFDNTLFVFLSDNGGVSITDNGELRGGKSSKYEGGLRVPFFATYVDGIPSGATYENQVIALDLASTFVKAAGGDLSENTYAELDGGDLIAAANGETSIHDRLFWRKSDTWSIVSDGTNKLIFDVHTDDFTRYDTLLYNLDEDLSEKSDIYSSNRASVQSMVADFKEWNATLDLPSWIGSQYLMPRVCGEVTDAKQCQIMIDRYADFAAATQMGNVAKKRWRVRLGESATLDKSTLEYVDPIKSAAVIEYQLEDLPRHGMLTKDGNPLESEDLFTQLDINTGMIKYVHGGSTASLDSIQYRVSDGSGHEDFDNQILKIIVDDHVFSAEFEDGDLSGSTEIRTTCAFAGEGEFVRLNEDGMITFPDINAPEAGNYLLRIYYYIDGDDANLELIVNGESSALLLPNADWCFVGPATEFVTLVSLQAGNNTISFKRSEDPPPSLDYFYIDELKPFPISFEANQLRLLEGDSIEVHISVPSKLPTSESFTVSLEGLSEEQYQLSQTALTINAGEQSTSTVLQSTGGVGSANLVLGGFSAYLKAGEQASMAVHILDEGQTIFISNSGSDSNDGLSLATALKSLEGINSLSLIPGDSVLFKRGEVFKGQLRPGGSGVEGKPIVISAYGEGSNPVIDGAAAEGGAFASAVYVENQDHLEISHLIVTNDRQSGRNGVADDQGYGIFLHNTGDRTMNHIRLRNLTVEHVYAFELDPEADFNSIDVAGILIRSEANQSEELARNINDVIIEDCYITRSGKFGVRLQHRNGDFGGDSLTRNSNIIIRNNHFHETGGSSILPGRVYNCLIENNIFDYPGSSADFRMPGRGSALWFFSSINGIAQHNISRHVRGPKDSYGYHIDFGNENIIYQYNYSEDAEGGFVEILGANKNIGYRYNVSVNDGLRSNARTFWMSGFAGSGRDPVKNEQAFVYNNTAYVGKQQHTDVHLENGELYIYNNVVFADEGAVIGEQVKISESEGFEVQNHNNLYFGDVRSAFAERDTAAVVGDPKFILAGDLDPNSYQLAEGSAALNGSSSLYPKLTFPMAGKGIFKDITEDPIVDFFGNPVDISAKPHLGAFNGPLGVQFVKAILSLSISQNSLKPGEQATITARIDRTLATNETVGIEVSDEIFSLYDLSNDTVFIPANANEGNVIISSKDTNEQLEENLDATISLFSPSTRLELGDSVNMAIQLINLQERVLGLQNAIKVSPFPNPASSQIEILGSKDVVDGVVYSTSGNKVILPMIGEGVFDVRALNEGVYLLLVKTIEGASRVGKLWIQRK